MLANPFYTILLIPSFDKLLEVDLSPIVDYCTFLERHYPKPLHYEVGWPAPFFAPHGCLPDAHLLLGGHIEGKKKPEQAYLHP